MRGIRGYLSVASMFGIMAVLAVGVSGQTARPSATLEDLLAEVRRLRSDIGQTLTASVRAQLLTTRLSLQEQRIRLATDRLAESRRQLIDMESERRARSEHMKRLEDLQREGTVAPSQARDIDAMLIELRRELAQSGLREQALMVEEQELRTALSGEQNLWIQFNAHLDQLERALTDPRQ
jgi:hypothetical protein